MKAVIFDLDGTLLDTIADIAHTINTVLTDNGFPVRSVEFYKKKIGRGIYCLIQDALPEGESFDESLLKSMHMAQDVIYHNQMAVLTRPYDGIYELLKALNGLGIKTGVLSNKEDCFTVKLIQHYFPDITFEAVAGSGLNFPRKPNPASLLAMAAKMNVSTSDMLFVGDSEVDVKTGKNAGIKTIACTWGFRTEADLRSAGAEIIVNSPSEILNYL